MAVFNLGDIVSLNSHPYTKTSHLILIGGEPQLVPPLMIVVETLSETKTQYDEKSGDQTTRKGDSSCKCIWYSSKSHQFEETWISSRLLKIIHFDPVKLEIDTINKNEFIDRLVVFKTVDFELSKRKSSMSIEMNSMSDSKDKNLINPLLSFVSPVMQITQIVEFKPSDSKDPIYDQKTGERKRTVSKWIVKCKWYNPNEKISERAFPFECLSVRPTVNNDFLQNLELRIQNFGFYKLENALIQPKKMLYLNGYYFLKAFDYVNNKNVDIKIDHTDGFKEIDNYYNLQAPNFDFADGEILPADYFITQTIDAIEKGISGNYYLRIKYCNRLGAVSFRSIKNSQKLTIKEGESHVVYLKGYCSTKKDFRHFRIDRIQNIQVLNIKY